MSAQPTLVGVEDETVPCPLCVYMGCQPKGRAVLGPPRDSGECVTRTITCTACHATGEESTRTK